jgi:hypothetical protein
MKHIKKSKKNTMEVKKTNVTSYETQRGKKSKWVTICNYLKAEKSCEVVFSIKGKVYLFYE